MPSRAIPTFLLLMSLVGCADQQRPRSVYVYHIGSVGCAGSPADGSVLRVEDRAADGVVRVTNPTASDIKFYYDAASSFGDYQMFFVRFRDGFGKPIPISGMSDCDFYSPKVNHADLLVEGKKPDRKSFAIPAGGSLDIKRDLTDFFLWWRGRKDDVTGPCQVQIRLYGYLNDRTWDGIGAVTQWQPSPCPGE